MRFGRSFFVPWLETIVNRISFEFLLIAPLCAAALVGVLSVFFRRKRPAVWIWLFLLSLSCGLLAFHDKGGGTLAFGYGCLFFAFILLLSLLLLIRHGAGKRANKSKENPIGEGEMLLPKKDKKEGQKNFSEDRLYTGMPLAKKELVGLREGEEKPSAETSVGGENADVRLEHVFQVLKKLQGMKLSAGDRLETDVIGNMLNVYTTKGTLSAEETRALNNYLATLLKLMSKYSV